MWISFNILIVKETLLNHMLRSLIIWKLFMCRKQVALDFFNTTILHETTMQILDRFKSIRSPDHWVNYIMPEDARFYPSSDNRIPSDASKFDQLMVETRSVLARYLYYV